MPRKPNFDFERRQKDMRKQKKRQEKLEAKRARREAKRADDFEEPPLEMVDPSELGAPEDPAAPPSDSA